jgi:site-specific DNA-methyltransferase (adenine-specific)/modification methylase
MSNREPIEYDGAPWKRREVIGDATLLLGDCRAILPTLGKVDAVVTDPPYGLGDWNNRGSNAGGPFDSNVTQLWDTAITADALAPLFEMSKFQIIWGANYIGNLPRSKQMLVWNKGIRGMHFNDCEIAWCSQWREASRVFDLSPSGLEKQHPTQKPLRLMQWCISMLPEAAKVVLDPYMGSGTSGVAALNLGRKFIGIEIEPRYFQIACKRIEEAHRQPRLFAEPAPRPVQTSLLDLTESAS